MLFECIVIDSKMQFLVSTLSRDFDKLNLIGAIIESLQKIMYDFIHFISDYVDLKLKDIFQSKDKVNL